MSKGSSSRCSVRLGLVLAGLLVGLLVAEGIARTQVHPAYHHHLHQRSEDPFLGIDLRPGADFTFHGAWVRLEPTRVRVSAQGLRDRSFELPKPTGARRLVCLGDSTTFGWGVEEDEGWCGRLESLLGPPWETVNLGVPGQNTSQEVRRLATQGLRFEPDIVVLQHEEGDFEPPVDTSMVGTLPYAVVARSALARLFIAARADGSTPFREDAGPGSPDTAPRGGGSGAAWDGAARLHEAFLELAELGRSSGFEVLVFTAAPVDEVRQGLDRAGLAWLDVLPLLEGPPDEIFIPRDGHWTAEGHRRVAEAVASDLHARGLIAP